ncbi:MAG: DUF2784 domain-containing protein [Nitrospira sp.]|uniref:DUF2784 domain-containing protein n=1 Tax=Nitrospira defluvii TaxID=330214 RepID=A0ABM8RJP0_9BACT|nr:DUF2784 domain-containing protein [Nitrospira defluvii]MCS6326671.1 DUF2784 domain-containing protein [Nitrospira sp.]CAE6756694.1 conserved membrane hypothetical protein [Nitrospira defluvii]
MWYHVGADLILLLHLGFVLFVIAGGLLLLKWPRIAWVHLPAAVWGAVVEFTGWICPLTPLESQLRALAGESATEADFIGRYLPPLLYPETLTREIQMLLGLLVLGVNLALYWLAFFRPAGKSP